MVKILQQCTDCDYCLNWLRAKIWVNFVEKVGLNTKFWHVEHSWKYVADIPPWLGRKARNDETKSNRGTKSRNVHDNWCQRIYTVLKRLAQLLLLALKPGKLSNFKDKFESLYLSAAADVSLLDYIGLMYWLHEFRIKNTHLRLFTIVCVCLDLFQFFTFVYICLRLFTFVYVCLRLFTFVYVCLRLFTFD